MSFLTRWFWECNLGLELQHLLPLKYKILIKVFQYILKSIETFLIQNYFYGNAKKYKSDKRNRDKF